MQSRNYLPQLVNSTVTGGEETLDVAATRADDGQTLVLQVVNLGEKAVNAAIQIASFVPKKAVAQATTLSGPLDGTNTADMPSAFTPKLSDWKHEIDKGRTKYTFSPHSFTVLRFE